MQDFGKESVEERVTGVEEVEAMSDEFSLRLKTKDQRRNKDLNYKENQDEILQRRKIYKEKLVTKLRLCIIPMEFQLEKKK